MVTATPKDPKEMYRSVENGLYGLRLVKTSDWPPLDQKEGAAPIVSKYGPSIRLEFEITNEGVNKGVLSSAFIPKDQWMPGWKTDRWVKLLGGKPETGIPFEFDTLIGSECIGNIVSAKSGERTYNKITDIFPLTGIVKQPLPPVQESKPAYVNQPQTPVTQSLPQKEAPKTGTTVTKPVPGKIKF